MTTVSDFVIDRLSDWGVDRIYGYPGDGINGLMGALRERQDKIEFVQTRHEELAAFMACAHAKFTDEVGVCMATSGPGAIHLLNGLYDAKKDHRPVVAVVGQQATTAMGSDYQQEVDLITLFKDVAGEYVHMCTAPSQARQLIDRAMRVAKADRCVTCVILPNDIQEEDYESPERAHGHVFTGMGYERPAVIPCPEDLEKAAEVLNEGRRVGILIGAGTLGAREEVRQVAERLGAGVAKALLGKSAMDDDVPYCTGAIGLLGTKPSWTLMNKCDTLLMIGTSFPYSEFLPEEGTARCVQIDVKARMLSLRYPADVPLHGDTKSTLDALLPMLDQKDKGWQERIEFEVSDWWRLMEKRAYADADPINPQRVFWEASPLLPDDAILTSDSGSAANWFARDIKSRGSMMSSLSGGLATMCPGVPYALAAKMTHPDRAAVAFVGDGAMQMLGNNGLITVAHHWQEWSDPRLIVCVLNNKDLNQVTWEQRVMAGDPKFEGSQTLPAFDFATYARQLGLHGIHLEDPDDIELAWKQALSADRPTVIDAYVDPEVPPLPPHIKVEQAKGYLKAIFKGEPNRRSVIRQSYRQMLQSFMPTVTS